MTLNFVSQPSSTNCVLFATNPSLPVIWQSLSTNLARPDGNPIAQPQLQPSCKHEFPLPKPFRKLPPKESDRL